VDAAAAVCEEVQNMFQSQLYGFSNSKSSSELTVQIRYLSLRMLARLILMRQRALILRICTHKHAMMLSLCSHLTCNTQI